MILMFSTIQLKDVIPAEDKLEGNLDTMAEEKQPGATQRTNDIPQEVC